MKLNCTWSIEINRLIGRSFDEFCAIKLTNMALITNPMPPKITKIPIKTKETEPCHLMIPIVSSVMLFNIIVILIGLKGKKLFSVLRFKKKTSPHLWVVGLSLTFYYIVRIFLDVHCIHTVVLPDWTLKKWSHFNPKEPGLLGVFFFWKNGVLLPFLQFSSKISDFIWWKIW